MSANITLMGAFNATYLTQFTTWLKKQAVEGHATFLTQESEAVSVVRMTLAHPIGDDRLESFRNALLMRSDDTQIDHIYQSSTLDIRQACVAVFDMDSTLIKAEVMDELAIEMGIGEQVAAVTASAMRGD